MIVHRAFRYRLDVSPQQQVRLRQFAGVVRLVYNLALEQRRDWWRHYRRATGGNLNYVAQARELTALRAEFDFIAAVSQTCQQQALRDLDRAFGNFFSGRASFPTPRRKGTNDAFRFQGREVEVRRLNKSWGMVRLPKIGFVRFRWTRAMSGAIQNVTVSLDPLGWHVSFACAVENASAAVVAIDAEAEVLEAVGIDRGISHTLAFSDTRLVPSGFADLPRETLRRLDQRARRQARILARRKRGSARAAQARKRLCATRARAARIRKQFNHVMSARIAACYRTVVLEDLKTRNMTASARGTMEEPGRNVRAKAGLNRSILEQGWHQFQLFLSYKLEARSGFLVTVPAAYTSQTCAQCGSASKQHRKSQSVFSCCDCGHEANADTNAAINILRAGTRPAVRKQVTAPVTRVSRKAA